MTNINKINEQQYEKHSYHLVDISPWPFFVALSAFFMVFGLVLSMHFFFSGFPLFFLGFFSIIFFSFMWWRDVVREATFEGQHTFVVKNGLRLGMILFIVSEVMLFFAFFWAFFHSSLNPTPFIGAVWPPKGIEVVYPWFIPLLNTALLLTSGGSLTWAHFALLQRNYFEVLSALLITILLGTVFTLFQIYEYLNSPFDISDSVYGSTFFMLTGLHGFHVLVGTIFLGVAFYRTYKQHFTASTHLGFECAAWYWHFVDIVWIFLFLAVYIWSESI